MELRKIAAALTALCLLFALSACGGGNAPAEVKPSVVTPRAESTPAPAPDETPEPTPEATPSPEPEPSEAPEPDDDPAADGWEPDWTLLDFTEVEGAVRFVRERYDSMWRSDYGDERYDHIETLTAYDEEDRVLFERTVDSAGWASEYVYTWGVPCYEYDFETYVNGTRFRSNHGDDSLSRDVFETVTDVRICTENSGTEGVSKVEYEYDTKGNLTQELTVIPSEGAEYPVCVRTYTYDSWDGSLIREVFAEGAGAGTEVVTEYEYEDGLLRKEHTSGQDHNDGSEYWHETVWEYDADGDVTAEETRYDDGVVERIEYEYDEVMGGVARAVFTGPNGNSTTTYAYTGWGDVESSRTEYEGGWEVDTLEYYTTPSAALSGLRRRRTGATPARWT